MLLEYRTTVCSYRALTGGVCGGRKRVNLAKRMTNGEDDNLPYYRTAGASENLLLHPK